MADININSNFVANPTDKSYPKSTPPANISIHAAKACTLNFSPDNCFNLTSLSFNDNEEKDPAVVNTNDTTYTISGGGVAEDIYDISFTSPITEVKKTVKRAPAKAKKAAKKKPAAKKTAKRAAGVKKSSKTAKPAKKKPAKSKKPVRKKTAKKKR